ncbi:MAG: shikimate kinase [Candidatus Marinimicrobia bacterium]|nr:shikimate kinase [Candidatus Neomarinimicrobiota bacterium]
MNIYLIGMMGSGKSTVGNILAKKMKRPFVDLDETIERSVGKSITDIFEIDGEDIFRKLESDHLRKVSGSVVSCGGGIILREENCNFIQENGVAILLTASMKELARRLSNSNKRPLLADNNTEETLTNLWLQRQVQYLSTADMTIETDEKSAEQISNEILSQLNS